MVPEVEQFYIEGSEIPDDEALDGYADEEMFERIAEDPPELEDLQEQARATYRFLTAGV
jgi:hypothetical protein